MTRAATALFENRYLLVLTVVLILVAGGSALVSLPRIEDPRILNRYPIVITRVPGAPAERIEALVTEKLEERLQEVSEIQSIDSTSRAGVSIIRIELADRVDDTAQVNSEIRDKLAEAVPSLPPEANAPFFDDERGAVAFSAIVAITWERPEAPSLGILSRLAEELADRLRNLPGTEVVRLYGEPEEELTVSLDHREVAALALRASEIAARVRESDAKVPSGTVRSTRSDFLMEVAGKLDSLERVGEIPLRRGEDGSLVRLSDVARIEKDWRDPPVEIGLVNGRRAVLVAARMDGAQRADVWAARARTAIDGFAAGIGPGSGVGVETIFDQNLYTSERLGELSANLAGGGVVVVLVILAAMGVRSSLVMGFALPLTAAAAFFGLVLTGGTLQQMSIFGMIIALGLLIDNAIVVVDEIAERLAHGASRIEALRDSVDYLFAPLLASTMTTVLAFAPIPLLIGNVGDFVRPIGMSVILALVASFVLALTVVAAVAAIVIHPRTPGQRWWESGLELPFLSAAFARFLRRGLGRPAGALAVALALPVSGFALAGQLGNQFFPRVDRNMFDVQVWLPTESSLEETERVAREVERVTRRYTGVTDVYWLVGASFPSVYYNLIMTRDAAPHYARGVVRTETPGQVKALLEGLQAELDARLPEAQVLVRQFGQGPPIEAEIEIELSGPSITVLQDLGEEIRGALYRHPDVLHTQATMERGEPKLWIDVDEDDAELAGLSLRQVAGQLQANLEGVTGGSVIEELEELPVRIRFEAERRRRSADVLATPLVTPARTDWTPLSAVARLALRPEHGAITRCDTWRCNTVRAYLRPDALPLDVADDLLPDLERSGFGLPDGYRLDLGGDSEEQAKAIGGLLAFAPLLAVTMVATVVLAFRSVTLAGVLFGVAGLSVGIGLFATFVSGFPFSFNSILGTAGLIGVALNDSIVVLAALQGSAGARRGEVDAIVEAVQGTGRHVVSTTLTTMGGFLPLLLFVGGDFWPPLAIVLALGVAGSSVLAVVFVPVIYRRIVLAGLPAEIEAPGPEWVEAQAGGAS